MAIVFTQSLESKHSINSKKGQMLQFLKKDDSLTNLNRFMNEMSQMQSMMIELNHSLINVSQNQDQALLNHLKKQDMNKKSQEILESQFDDDDFFHQILARNQEMAALVRELREQNKHHLTNQKQDEQIQTFNLFSELKTASQCSHDRRQLEEELRDCKERYQSLERKYRELRNLMLIQEQPICQSQDLSIEDDSLDDIQDQRTLHLIAQNKQLKQQLAQYKRFLIVSL